MAKNGKERTESRKGLHRQLLESSSRRLRRMWQRACTIGAIADSSRHLARCMVGQVDFSVPGLIVELGPGHGAVTQCLRKETHDQKRLLLLELLGDFIPRLKRCFPGVRVVHDSAERLPHYVRGRAVAAVISGLPLRSLPAGMVERIGRALGVVMNARTRYIQFTYDLRPSDTSYFSNIGLRKISSRIVLRNFPPARVDTFVRS
ncbi:MAG: hypothetical protein HQM02_03980 [Magnetococcales bacterium]|nr:hypothetical protein [Magnetococcales bacterium]